MSFVSIIMPVRNHIDFVRESVQSVLNCGYENFELIICDGFSTDGTLDVLYEFARSDRRIRVFSSEDSGPADALNKGIKSSRGSVIGWLNSDDLYCFGAIDRALDVLLSIRSPVMVYGRAVNVDSIGLDVSIYPTKTPDVGFREFPAGCFICQPTVFFKRTVPVVVGDFDSRLRTAFDFDYWIRVFKLFPGRIGFVDAVQAKARVHPMSITSRMRREVSLEGLSVLFAHFGRAPAHWALTHIFEVIADRRADIGVYLAGFLCDIEPYLSKDDYEWVRGVASKAFLNGNFSQ
jgi:glycosyltransferase involved in cell wall biosynthesis